MAKEENARFEIAADMRALAEKSVEQAKQAFDIFISAAQHAVSTAKIRQPTRKLVPRRWASLPWGSLNATSRPRDVMALHAEYVKSQIEALSEQGRELGKRVSKMSGQGFQP